MIWHEVKILTTLEASDAISDWLSEQGAKGVSILDPEEVRFLEANPQLNSAPDFVGFEQGFLDALGDDVVVKAYFSDLHNCKLIVSEVDAKLKQISEFLDIGKADVSISEVDEEDWATSWKKYYKPIKISNRIVIKPTWEEYEPKEGEVILELDPGMAFGTGTHETTSMCLKLIDEYMTSEIKSVLDVGCGTGILGIATALLGAKKVRAYDIDENSVRITRENAEINNVENIVSAKKNDLLKGVSEGCDLVVANIVADIVILLLADARTLLERGGIMVISGIIHERVVAVENALSQNGFEIDKKMVDGEWNAYALRAV
ncbi:MAG: 50S ribosomal protein L11 methyltransferase [Bacillota bacterium]